jgi:hypothetical protein
MSTAKEVLSRLRISDVAQALGVKVDRIKHRGVAAWRDGRRFSVSFNDDKNVWHDFVTGEAGGILDLIARIRGGNRADALRWAAHFVGVELDDLQANAKGRKAWAEWRHSASAAAEGIAYWRDALVPELNARKVSAVAAGDNEALGRAALLCNLLENGSAEDVVREFIRHRSSDPAEVERLIAEGCQHDREGQLIAAAVVLMLAKSVAEDKTDAA